VYNYNWSIIIKLIISKNVICVCTLGFLRYTYFKFQVKHKSLKYYKNTQDQLTNNQNIVKNQRLKHEIVSKEQTFLTWYVW